MKLAKCLIIVFGILVSMAAADLRAGDPEAALRASGSGKRALEYIEAFNSGDTVRMAAFFDANLSVDGKARRPIAERLGRFRQMQAEIARMDLRQVEQVSDTLVVLYVTNPRDQWLQLDFVFEQSTPHYLAGIGIELLEEPPSAVDRTPLTKAQMISQIDHLIDSLAALDRFSGSVIVDLGGEEVVRKAVGYADIGLKAPNQIDTKYNLGSINKIFTKTAIAQLLQSEKIRLDAPIGQYLIDYPNRDAATKVTVKHLLEMTGGIGDFFGEAFDKSPKDSFRDNGSFISLFANLTLEFEPGSDRRYSNGGYILLGAIIEAVTGQTYYQYVHNNICVPAGMTNTGSYEADAIVPNLAQGYTTMNDRGEETGQRRSNIYSRPARGSAAGGGYSTAEDMLKFVRALRGGKLLSGRHTAFMFTNELPESEPSDLATAIKQGGLGIAGGAPGINAAVEANNGRDYVIAVLGNYDPPSAENLARKIRLLVDRVAP